MTPEPLPAELADLLKGGVGVDGLPGVLADWIDERSEAWAPLAAALRVAVPAPKIKRESYHSPPRYLMVADGVMVWLTEGHAGNRYQIPLPVLVPRLGFHRTTGRAAAFRLDLPADWPGLEALRGLFGAV